MQERLPHLTEEAIADALAYYRDEPGLVNEDIARQEQASAELTGRGWPDQGSGPSPESSGLRLARSVASRNRLRAAC